MSKISDGDLSSPLRINHLGIRDRKDLRDLRGPLRDVQKQVRPASISSADLEDVQTAGASAQAAFSRFLLEPEDEELFTFVIDGKTSAQRNDSEFVVMSRLTGFLKSQGGTPEQGLSLPKFMAAVLPDESDARVFTTSYPDGDIKVFLSKDLGFREAMIAAQEGYSDVTVQLALRLGVKVMSGDVGRRLNDVVSTGRFPELEFVKPDDVSIDINGKTFVGTLR